ncbi:hypothetical protein LZ31DRAFT_133075 [Colletotrichum somersetense]|nr:hypothetical protein LZ31DRAFT_133075 [Colletotrichum somersetense]
MALERLQVCIPLIFHIRLCAYPCCRLGSPYSGPECQDSGRPCDWSWPRSHWAKGNRQALSKTWLFLWGRCKSNSQEPRAFEDPGDIKHQVTPSNQREQITEILPKGGNRPDKVMRWIRSEKT